MSFWFALGGEHRNSVFVLNLFLITTSVGIGLVLSRYGVFYYFAAAIVVPTMLQALVELALRRAILARRRRLARSGDFLAAVEAAEEVETPRFPLCDRRANPRS